MAMRVEATSEFVLWLDSLEDRAGRARIQVRIERLIHGNPGKHRNLAGGVSELKIDTGPG
jgi:putative addiction module killer protein